MLYRLSSVALGEIGRGRGSDTTGEFAGTRVKANQSVAGALVY